MFFRAYTQTDLLLFFIFSELRGRQRTQTDLSLSLHAGEGGGRLIIEILNQKKNEIMVMLCLYHALSNFEKK